MTDPNVERVREKLLQRSEAGRLKYGTDTTRADLGLRDWLQHAQEEMMDCAVYLERIMKEAEKSLLPDEMLATPETQRRIIEAAEKRGYERAIKERIESALIARVLEQASKFGLISCAVPTEWIGRRVALVLLDEPT